MKAERERERGDFRIRDAERVVRYLFFFFFCGAISGGFFFFCEPFVFHKCKTLNSAGHKKGVEKRCF